MSKKKKETGKHQDTMSNKGERKALVRACACACVGKGGRMKMR